MSPEQAQMNNKDVDTRSDIYALGVLLYELLTGKTPFDTVKLMTKGQEAVFRAIRDDEPPRPSTRLSSLTAQERLAAGRFRGEAPEKLRNLLRGDLDWVVMKTLEKDRTRRYDSANALRDDILRFLGNEPITAVSPSALYRLRKFSRRNKLAFATSLVVAAALLEGLAIALVFYGRERAQRHLSETREFSARKAQYASDMRVASAAISDGDVILAKELLDSHIPTDQQEEIRGWAWSFFHGQLHQEERILLTLDGHFDELVFSHDGSLLAVSGNDGPGKLVAVFNTADWSLKQSIPMAPKGWVSGMRFSEDLSSLTVEQASFVQRYAFDQAAEPEVLLETEEKAWPTKATATL